MNQLILLLLFLPLSLSADILFEDNFDQQADWQTLNRSTIGDLPAGWTYGRTSEQWHPADGDSESMPSMFISGNDTNKVFGGIGKAFISYSESNNPTGWSSDGFIMKDIPPSDTVYVQFKIKFQSDFASDSDRGQIKIFRILHYDGVGDRAKFFSSGYSAPIYIYDWEQSNYGLRHDHAFRCDPQETGYFCTSPVILNPLRSINRGDMSGNYSSDLTSLNPQLPDLLNGGILPSDGTISHNQLIGNQWHTLAFYFVLNSAAGVQDGVFKHWFDGELIVSYS